MSSPLAPGSWFSFLDLPSDVTPEEVAEFFCQVLPTRLQDDQIAIEPMRGRPGSKVTISINKEQVRGIVNWLLTGKTLRGAQVWSTEPRNMFGHRERA